MRTPSYYELKEIFKRKGYTFFEGGSYDLNIFGIRSNCSQSNSFDDIVGVAYMYAGSPKVLGFPATTDPGRYWLKNPLNRKGTIILVPGQYRGVYRIGKHGWSSGNPYPALEQVKEMTYVRDNNRDSKLDFDLYRDPDKFLTNKIVENPKTNIHRASKWEIVKLVERYGAGCQVLQDPFDFEVFMNICEKAARQWGPTFSYTLLEEGDLK